MALSKGRCFTHGGGKTCEQDECEKAAVRSGKCYSHGGAKKKSRIEAPHVGHQRERAPVPAGVIPQTTPSTAPVPLNATITTPINAPPPGVAVMATGSRATIATSLTNRDVFGGIDV